MKKLLALLSVLFLTISAVFSTTISWWQPTDEFGDPSGDEILQVYENGTYKRDSGTDSAQFFIEISETNSCYLVVKSLYGYQYSFYSGFASIKDENGVVWRGPHRASGYRSENYIDLGKYEEECWTSDTSVTSLKALFENNEKIKLAFSSDYSSGNVTLDLYLYDYYYSREYLNPVHEAVVEAVRSTGNALEEDSPLLTSEDKRIIYYGEANLKSFKQPVFLTSFGQSTDAAMLDTVMKRIGVDYVYNATATADTIKGYKTIVIAVGASTKGLGAAGLSEQEEIARAKTIMNYAVFNGIDVICCHIGGSARRDATSDLLTDMVLSQARLVVVKEDGIFDNKFTDYATENNIPTILVYATKDTLEVFDAIFRDIDSVSSWPVYKQAKLDACKIKVWHSMSGTSGQFFESQVKAFMEKYPQINVELTYTGSFADSSTNISAARLAGNAPDVIITYASQLYTGEDGNFKMESDVLDSDFDISDIRQGALEYASYKGHLASVPFSISTQVIYYNKELVAKAGYDLETKPPKSWDELLEVAKNVQSVSSIGTYGFDTSDAKWLVKSMLFQNDNEIIRMDENGIITPMFAEESGIEVARFWKRLVDEKVMAKSQHDNAENKFLSGKLVFIAASSNRISKWEDNVAFDIGAIEMPFFKQPCVALGGSTAAILTTDAIRHAASWVLLKFLLKTENQTAYTLASGYLPIRKSAMDNSGVLYHMGKSELYSTAIKQLDYSVAYTHFKEMGSLDTQLTWALDDIENGIDPKRAFQDAKDSLMADL